MSEWISVKEKDNSPIINETILITDGYDVFPAFLDSDLTFRMLDQENCEDIGFHVLYWMPLPSPPIEETK